MVKRRAFLVRGSNATAVLCAVATESVAKEAAAGASSLATRPMGNLLDPSPYIIGRRAAETVSRL